MGLTIEFFAFSILLRVLIGLWGYSGEGTPPLHGDFEAQRHWMEITRALPVGEWYRHSEKNDLLYWGLDYPPLTAYVSWLFGAIAEQVYPPLVEFYSSRGHESIPGKTFMRLSVILCDILVLLPSLLLFKSCKDNIDNPNSTLRIKNNQFYSRIVELLSLSAIPSLLLIDHGHFQYNGVCIGLSIAAAGCILKDNDILGAFLFSLSLNFKQMSLYYALVFFAVLLRKCLTQKSWLQRISKLICVGLTVILTFSILWLPFCVYRHLEDSCVESLLRVLSRQFPFSRGIFEDKVSNIWYVLSVVYDFRQVASTSLLTRLSVMLTLTLNLPTVGFLLYNPSCPRTMILALVTGSLAFFLASFQVHEKSLLLSLVPAALLMTYEPLLILWFQCVGTFTIFPLLIKDKLQIPYIVFCLLYTVIVCAWSDCNQLPPEAKGDAPMFRGIRCGISQSYIKILVGISGIGVVALHSMELFVAPPRKYPDIYPALFSIYGALHLCFFYLLFLWWLYQQSRESTLLAAKKNS